MVFNRRRMLAALVMAAAIPAGAGVQAGEAEVVLYKNASCGCCGAWAEHMRRAGFRVVTHELQDLGPIKSQRRIPAALASCHTAIVSGYAIEGHVPADAVRRLLKQKPRDVIGLAVPGMPQGAPGMDSAAPQRYDIIAFDAHGGSRVFEQR